MNYLDDDIEYKAVSTINWCIRQYREKVNEQLIEKINIYKTYIGNFLRKQYNIKVIKLIYHYVINYSY